MSNNYLKINGIVLIGTRRDIGHEWHFTKEQTKKLERYFKANLFLLDCLNLAVVSDREGIENSLLTL
ncbi:hypothetical protein BGP_3358 [Beggiatoa sp. PS]|nr:hypothetical protein BGP_3358 [Beggiatoa sp. PS]